METKNKIRKSALAPTILIAGGAGFIGSHLAEVLLKREARVIILDNFSTGKDIYINHLLQNPKFALFDIDINAGLPSEIESVDYVFHLAGLEEYLYSKDEVTLDSLLTNAVGTKNLLDLAEKSQAKFLLASTVDVYGGMMSQFSLEDYYGKDGLDEKKYGLAEAKRFAEALVWEYYKRHGTDARIVRLPEVYGPRMSLSSSGTLGQFLKNVIDNKNLIITGDGTQKEYYLYIDDAISGMVRALLNDKTEGKIFTLLPEKASTELETAYLVKSLANRQLDINFVDTEKQARRLFEPDTYSLSVLGWDPNTNFKDGVAMTLSWFGYQVNEGSFKNAPTISQGGEENHGTLTTLQGFDSPAESETQLEEDNLSGYTAGEIESEGKIPKVKKKKRNRKLFKKKQKLEEPGEIPTKTKHKKRRFRFSLPKPKKIDLSFSSVSFSSKLSLFIVVLISFLPIILKNQSKLDRYLLALTRWALA